MARQTTDDSARSAVVRLLQRMGRGPSADDAGGRGGAEPPKVYWGRYYRLITAAAVTGVLVGLVVAAFEYVTSEVLLTELVARPTWQQALAPFVGLVLTALTLRYLTGGASPATADEYVREFHERHPRLPFRELPGKLIAGTATIGLGGAVGLEGPSVYAGANIGSNLQAWLGRFLPREDARLLLTAGAAAGVAAIFKTPATGVIFALEAPYQDDVARRALIPSLIAAASSYLTFVAIAGAEPVIPALGLAPDRGVQEPLLGAVAIGLLAGLSARGFAWLIRRAKAPNDRYPLHWRIVVGGALLGGLAVASAAAFDEPLTLGPGYQVIEWIADPTHALPLVALLFFMRMAATVTTVGARGAGGLFIPLAVQGVVLGRLVGGLLDRGEEGLFPTLGLAAFLGAGYRAPLASVMFVAETTRGSRFVVPALVAAAVSQLVIGRASVSSYQRSRRLGHLERRFMLPISTALTTDVLTVPPDATAAEFVWVHVLGRREREVPVVGEGDRYLGTVRLDEISELDREEWESTPVGSVMRTDLPAALPSWTLRDAIAAMEQDDVDILPVVDGEGLFIGVVGHDEILKLDEILDETGG